MASRARLETQLVKDARNVLLDGRVRYDKRLRDSLIRLALGELCEHLALARAELV